LDLAPQLASTFRGKSLCTGHVVIREHGSYSISCRHPAGAVSEWQIA
jgi:hypothetical protein